MKILKKLIVLFVLFFATQIFAQTPPNYYVVLVKAKWCSTCQKNESRVNTILSKVDKNIMTVITNDLTNKETKLASAEILKANGLENVKLRSNGILFFVNAQSKKIVESIPISKTNEEIINAIERVKNF